MKKENQVNQSRRDLLKGLGTAAVVAGVSTQTVASEASSESKEPLKKGYHETQHIRDYYNTL
ncbi:transcriptional initiation protein Tat [Vibrio cholerae]|uniref:twin-arginine translocation signal domain-containing protein n=1 Tax=Vibrio cholerae TaxID=666 RepID=UPI0008937E88|nr:twin-arginine translocation signal domain-containing protein [Vibrio cholerae]OFJ33803.1 transcriptional initiation protein Tat [Vibrio cholerae]